MTGETAVSQAIATTIWNIFPALNLLSITRLGVLEWYEIWGIFYLIANDLFYCKWLVKWKLGVDFELDILLIRQLLPT